MGLLGAHLSQNRGTRSPQGSSGDPGEDLHTFRPEPQGDGGSGVPGCEKGEGFGATGEELSEWMEEEVSLFSIMSAPVPKCLRSESLSLSHFYLHLSL